MAANAFYGTVQVQAIIANGKLANIKFLQWPNDRARSIRINQQALPMLTQEAIQGQSNQVDVVSGATDSSYAFAESLKSALGKAES
ncbi:MAG: FMN-binding protein [Candidatus Dormibacteraceae bacterium]